MGPVVKLLQAIASLTRSGAIKKIDDAYRLAQRELGERFSQYQNQIKDAFNQGQKELTKITNKPTADIIPFQKKEGIESLSKGKVKQKGEVIEASFKPGKDKYGKVVEESPSQASGTSPVMQRLEKGIESLKQMKKPGMDLATGLTKTAARSILNRKGIEVPDKVDPTEIFIQEFGADVLGDVQNVAEEMIELQRMGKSTKSMDEILEQEGMFDLKRGRTDMPKGYTDEEMEEIKKAIEQEDILLGFDPKGRKPSAMGGIQRTNFAIGAFSKATVLIQRLKNTLKAYKGDNSEMGKYVNETFPNFIKEIEANPKLADNPEVAKAFGITDLGEASGKQRLVEYEDGSVDFFTKGSKKGMDSTKQLSDELGISMEEAIKIKQMEPEDQVLEIQRRRRLLDKSRTKQAEGGLSYLMGM